MSQYVSSDGLVAWKSSRLGANFYTPNIFTKDVGELSLKLLDVNDNTCKYPVDIMIIAGISTDSLQENCRVLSKYATENTSILISADFGCELEEIALSAFGKQCKCVLSIACEVECRQLSLGSYALVNDDNCKIYFGLTYSSKKFDNEQLLLENEEKVLKQLENNQNSDIGRMITQLTATQWIKVELLRDSQKMAVKMWEFIIPKISLNILSIVYEQFNYETMLENKSTEVIFKDLVKELLGICFAQCNSNVEEFLLNTADNNENEINFEKIVDQCKRKKMDLINTTANEYPEYLSLPFESYCFYHRFEYPAHVLLYQPILLAKKYDVPCSNLNFLYGFYSRLLSLSGLSINGGRCEQHVSLFDKQLAEALSPSDPSDTNAKANKQLKSNQNVKKRKKKKVKKRSSARAKVKGGNIQAPLTNLRPNSGQGIFSVASPTGPDCRLPADLETVYLDSHVPSSNSQTIPINGESTENQSRNSESEESDLYSTASSAEVNSSDSDNDEKEEPRESLDAGGSGSIGSRKVTDKMSRGNSQGALEDFGIIAVPHFKKRFPSKPFNQLCSSLITDINAVSMSFDKTIKRPYTTTSLELQLRTGPQLIAKEYQDLHKKIYDLKSPPNQSNHDEKRKKFAQMEKQLWQLQRRFNIYNGTIPRPKPGPYEDLLDHINVLNRHNSNDILRSTTSRYGDVDLYTSIQKDRDHIVSLFENQSRHKQKPIADITKTP